MSVQKRRSYDDEFKKNAVLLYDEQGRTVAGVAVSLGIPEDMLYRWRRELTAQKKTALQIVEKRTEEQREIKEHRNEIPVREVKTLYVSDEEDVPDPTNFHQRILCVV